MIIISVDAMGGDFGLDTTIPGVKYFLARNKETNIILVGHQEKINEKLTQYHLSSERISIHHATQIIEMDEIPSSVLKNKQNSSMRIAIDLVKKDKAQAAVSAGNTGALIAISHFVLKMIPGIKRPAIAKFLPGRNKHSVCMLDLGANVECTPEQLTHFAILGSELVSFLYPEKKKPTIALLNIGIEKMKGSETYKNTYQILQQSKLNFIGNIEGNDIQKGKADIIVCDGFTGNIALKTIEGSLNFLMFEMKKAFKHSLLSKLSVILAKPTLTYLKNQLNPKKFNGAIILGINGIVIKSHGSADALSFAYALHEAYHEVKTIDLSQLKKNIDSHIQTILPPTT